MNSEQSKNNKRVLLILLLLTMASLATFRQTCKCDFISYDDPEYVTENTHIRHGITPAAIWWAFTTVQASNWHPLTWMSHMLDVQLFGLNPGGHHLVNLLFHTANALLLFLIFHRMTKALWKSALVAALFAVHPLHVESVAWVAERKDVLSTFFWMLTMYAYIHYVNHRKEDGGWGTKDARQRGEKGNPSFIQYPHPSAARFPSTAYGLVLCDFRYWTVIALFSFGLMAKPMLVTLPFVLVLLDYWPLRRFEEHGSPSVFWLLLREKIPLFLPAALSCIVTYLAQQRAGSVASFERIPLSARITNAFVSYFTYLKKTIWPIDLAVFYPYSGLRPVWQVLGAALILGAVTFAIIKAAKRFPYLPVGWLWFIGTLVPVIGIVQVGRQAMADRYAYIPLIGLFVMASWGIPELLKKWRYLKEPFWAVTALVLISLFIASSSQVGYWSDSISLYDHALSVTGPNDIILNNRGVAYAQLGNLVQAISDYDSALEINPRNAETQNNRGIAYGKLGDHMQAIDAFSRAINTDPEYVEAHTNRCVAYNRIGMYRKAIEDCDIAITIDPAHTEAYFNRGVAYGEAGDHRQAIENFDRVIGFDPQDGRAYFNRAVAFEQLGNRLRALEDLKIAARLGNEDAKNLLLSNDIKW